MTKLKDYFNKITNDYRLYTAEDIGEMSGEEFSGNEKAIDYQMETLGIPRRGDLAGNPDVIYVHSYTKDDGTKVKAHYRTRPDGRMNNNLSFLGSPTGGAAEINKDSRVFKTGITYNDARKSMLSDYWYPQNNKYLNEAAIELLKNTITFGIGTKKYEQPDAVNLWKISAEGFYNNWDYISKNGDLYYNMNEFELNYPEYKKIVEEKIKSQFHKTDVPGIVFHEGSSLAQAIEKSPELKNYINENYNEIVNKKELKNKSFSFSQTKNLHNSFGLIDVLSAKKSSQNTIDIILLDTYDFNKDDHDWKVQLARKVQDANYLIPYFTIVKCRYRI